MSASREGARGPWRGTDLEDSPQQQERGFPMAREALKGFSNDDLRREYSSLLRASSDRMFGHNAQRLLKLVEAEMAERPDMKLSIRLKDGAHKTVECFGRFRFEVDNQSFELAVTQNAEGLGKSVTHVDTGLRVCSLTVGEPYLLDFTNTTSDIGRARVCLQQLVDRHGVRKVRSILARAFVA